MLILALDSTAVTAAVALCRDTEMLASFQIQNGNTHSETLLPMVEAMLKATGVTVDDIDLFAASEGPGSFTGVRIGAATLKGLAFGRGKPCVGVSALEALAQNLVPTSGILCPVMNARRGQLYNALFRVENGTLHRLCPDRAIATAELEAELLAMCEPVTVVGDGIDVVKAGFKSLAPLFPPAILQPQNAISVALCAHRAALIECTVTDKALSPTYLRLPQAERERLEREKEKKSSQKEVLL